MVQDRLRASLSLQYDLKFIAQVVGFPVNSANGSSGLVTFNCLIA